MNGRTQESLANRRGVTASREEVLGATADATDAAGANLPNGSGFKQRWNLSDPAVRPSRASDSSTAAADAAGSPLPNGHGPRQRAASPELGARPRRPSDSSGDEGTFRAALRTRGRTGGVFANAEDIKEQLKDKLKGKEYSVFDFYKTTGRWQMVARSSYFENITLLVISLNAVWIWVDTDYNTAATPADADFGFVLGENLFCMYFSMEWLIRFMAFREKRNCLKDSWMVFDSCLVIAMVAETWLVPFVMLVVFNSADSADMGDASILRMMRLLRLTRMARMVRLLRAVPELMTMVRGVVASARSVFLAGILLVALMFVFGIALRQLSDGSEVGDELFPTVHEAMITLLIHGVFLDEFGEALRGIGSQSYLTAFVFMCFICLAGLTVMNMLIGVVCELVSAVAAREKEERTIMMVKEKVSQVMRRVDDDGDGLISKAEFLQMVQEPDCVEALSSVGVDVPGLLDIMDMIFLHRDPNSQDSDGEPVLTYDNFIETVYGLRGSNGASVKDIVDLRKFVHQGFENLGDMVRSQLLALWPKKGNGNLEHTEDTLSNDKRFRRLEGQVSRILELLESQQGVGVTRTKL